MGYSNVITPLIAKGLKLLGLAIPLAILGLITLMTVQAYDNMTAQANNDMTNIEVVSSFEFKTATLLQTTLRGR